MELIPKIDKEDTIRSGIVRRKQQEYHLIGSMNHRKGHQTFCFNTVTKELRIAQIERKCAFDLATNSAVYHSEIKVEKDCIYFEALNEKNAIKHLRKEGYTDIKTSHFKEKQHLMDKGRVMLYGYSAEREH